MVFRVCFSSVARTLLKKTKTTGGIWELINTTLNKITGKNESLYEWQQESVVLKRQIIRVPVHMYIYVHTFVCMCGICTILDLCIQQIPYICIFEKLTGVWCTSNENCILHGSLDSLRGKIAGFPCEQVTGTEIVGNQVKFSTDQFQLGVNTC